MVKSIIIWSIFVYCADCYNILGLFQYAGRSHFMAFEQLLISLSERGHNVTVISFFPQKMSVSNYTDISLIGTTNFTKFDVPLGDHKESFIEKHRLIFFIAHVTNYLCDDVLKSNELQGFIRRNEKFDVILHEYYGTHCFMGLVYNSGAALVALSSTDIFPWTTDTFAQPDNPAYIPSMTTGYISKLTFFQRVENSIAYMVNRILHRLVIANVANEKAKENININLPDLDAIAHNTSLILLNVFHVLSGPRPLVPTVIEVGGMHIGKPKKIPKNIEKWINESTHGVIYFSMGSMIKGHTFPEEKRKMFLRAFGRLQQRVLWKWENDTMPGKPENVMIQKWMPQFDILCHPNVKAFISHGGLLGTTEAVHCGVPAVVMPQYGDQYTNARALEASGGGVILQFSTVTEEDVYKSLKTVLDPSFNKKAKELSERFRDRPMPPLETAIYWVEYVARHKGAPHLRTAAVGMPLYQYLLLDVIAFLLLVCAILTYLSYISVRFFMRKLFKKQIKKKKN